MGDSRTRPVLSMLLTHPSSGPPGSKSFIGLKLVVIRLMYPAGGESYQKFAVVLLTVLSF